ncbi:cupin domain-containing protein [Rhodococcus wratislaviensis]|uniref:cupin domain-containing protein n=1 Tax=Rhodococcus wratislaviensis TaxID=44752 RepID=UPI003650318B
MKIRRVVAGLNASGKSVFLSDEPAPSVHEFEYMPGGGQAKIWYAQEITTGVPSEEPTSATGPVLPQPGGASFIISKFAPATSVNDPRFDGQKGFEEVMTIAPDLAATMEPDAPGMHRTQTVDFAIVIEGEVWLEVDDGEQRRLTAGDTVIQLGARHGWHNKSDLPALVAFIMIGAKGSA